MHEYLTDIERLRSLADNYDDEGALAPSAASINSAIRFITDMAYGRALPGLARPEFGPGPGRSVDVHFMDSSCEILVNVDGHFVTFFAHSGSGDTERRLRGRDSAFGVAKVLSAWLKA